MSIFYCLVIVDDTYNYLNDLNSKNIRYMYDLGKSCDLESIPYYHKFKLKDIYESPDDLALEILDSIFMIPEHTLVIEDLNYCMEVADEIWDWAGEYELRFYSDNLLDHYNFRFIETGTRYRK